MIELRQPTIDDLCRIYAETEHVVAVDAGVPVAWAGFRQIDQRLWAMFGVLDEGAPVQSWRGVFYAFRRRLQAQGSVVSVLVRDRAAERLVRLVGFNRTDERYAGKEVWTWTPQIYS